MRNIKSVYLVIPTLILFLVACSKKDQPVDNSNKEMLDILAKVARQNFNKENPFLPEVQFELFSDKNIASETNTRLKTSAQAYKATLLLKLGREEEAINIFKQIKKTPGIERSRAYHEIMENFALANLRYGERTNCINSHMAESCVFPIKVMGMHHDETGSRKAIELFENILKKDPSDLTSRWLLNIAYMTLGEYPGKVPAAFLIPALDIDRSDVKVKPFKDIAADLRLNIRNKAGGAITDDFNNDGYLDIITSDWEVQNGAMHYFKNNGEDGFTDCSEQSGLGAFTGGLNMIQADYNNDGYTDIFVFRGAWLPGQFGKQPNSLLRNNGDGTFSDVTIKSGLLSYHPTQTGVFKDFNNDGWLDLFIGNETTNVFDVQPCELYMSNRNGTFTNIAKEAGCDIISFVKGVCSADYNNDGWEDIFISTYSGRRMLLKNEGVQNGKVHFKDVTHEAVLDDMYVKTFPTWFWDYDNDGWQDIFICGYDPGPNSLAYVTAAEALNKTDSAASKMYLYHNNHDGTFTNVSKDAGLDKCVFAMGSNFGDFDNDGYLDMYLGTGSPDYRSLVPNRLFKNIKGKKFADVTTVARMGNLQKGHGVSFADIDNDGDQDIFIEVGGAYTGDYYFNSLYQNPGQNNNRWICLSLEGTRSNRSAIGAKIKVVFRENGITRTVYRDENSGGSFGCSPLRKEIGIGMADIIDEIDITWPGTGETQTFKNIKPGRFLKIKQGINKIGTINLKTLDFKSRARNMVACSPPVKTPPVKNFTVSLNGLKN